MARKEIYIPVLSVLGNKKLRKEEIVAAGTVRHRFTS